MFGSTSTVMRIIESFQREWKCRVTGVIPRDDNAVEEEVSTLVFLGICLLYTSPSPRDSTSS
eukprot:4905801-Prorocentrum_lima.AAC.1